MTAPSPSAESRPGPLHGIRVLDFTAMLAGPHCARLMADLGAEVIKVEGLEGDMIRGRPPLRDGNSSYFGALNCGKAQPPQSGAVSHGCPSALFRDVRILNTTQEAGR